MSKRTALIIARKRRHLTQEQAAAKLGLSRKFYGEIERGQRDMLLETAIKIADFYGIDVRMLSMKKKVI
ncbi:helix-turn-helix transcriptional regulator [Thermaerobacillus caldiproteolyticus]|uniref:helix-turn-helix transcriptional regulator n=1 Tax=Thermaerobacillus caldiproteolyticus TaxID=247480 RepID=UPI00188D6C4F|nr:helix-turn-helix transcriptional regulator [Anoxybacillus caldiproteolyticus]QPA33399.1 helix-turn-helix transcriptional regulator [Anoxybacillus caldiproteolyticus]